MLLHQMGEFNLHPVILCYILHVLPCLVMSCHVLFCLFNCFSFYFSLFAACTHTRKDDDYEINVEMSENNDDTREAYDLLRKEGKEKIRSSLKGFPDDLLKYDTNECNLRERKEICTNMSS
ncbi:activator of Hsp90 ATPase, putative (AHA1) [Plasmodium ovale wallikeri]|uniref:Activator of Hsp90 ATPase, putative (AHA1) n=1 Tax=Plasmodium ovale wallikeri TaxID=864142 RepID=A0A1A8YT00_PLAOA|nr:activator of Hsp90 ATPase, putative (AHA1) [Plasmodium ovale wallikeri]SBT35104.1 activator of Hsp90 ATPase, putative (AHA1) [Plasmodium ovale wallikeri]